VWWLALSCVCMCVYVCMCECVCECVCQENTYERKHHIILPPLSNVHICIRIEGMCVHWVRYLHGEFDPLLFRHLACVVYSVGSRVLFLLLGILASHLGGTSVCSGLVCGSFNPQSLHIARYTQTQYLFLSH
jgi:hypothetical protein